MHSSSTDPRPVRGRGRAPRGAAFVEAILVLAILAVLWLGVRSLTKLGLARLDVSARARHCAWKTARSGCEILPPECIVRETTNRPEGTHSPLDAARQGTSAPEAVSYPVEQQLDDLPGSRVRITAERDVSVRLVRGGTGSTTTATLSLACAPRPSEPGNLAREVFDGVRGQSDD